MHFRDQPSRRLIASGCVPDRAGQPTQIQLHISLEELTRRLAGTPAAALDDPPAGKGWAEVAGCGPGSPQMASRAAAPGRAAARSRCWCRGRRPGRGRNATRRWCRW